MNNLMKKNLKLYAVCALALFALTLSSVGAQEQKATAAGGARGLTPQERRGRAIYLRGESPSGKEIQAVVGEVDVPGSALTCAGCHGARGEGAGADDPEAPLLIGPRGLTGFRHVLELYEFTRDSMPQDQPSSLSAEQYWNVTAWLMSQNGIPSPGGPLGPENAASIPLARR